MPTAVKGSAKSWLVIILRVVSSIWAIIFYMTGLVMIAPLASYLATLLADPATLTTVYPHMLPWTAEFIAKSIFVWYAFSITLGFGFLLYLIWISSAFNPIPKKEEHCQP